MFTCRKRAGTTPVYYIVAPFGYMVYIQYIGGSTLRALSLYHGTRAVAGAHVGP